MSRDWLQPAPEEQGLQRYLSTIRERLWLVVLAVVISTGAAVLYLVNAEEVYEAEADILINPVPADTELLVSLGLLRDTGDSLRVVETAARLITTPPVAERAANLLGLQTDEPEDLLDDVSAEPVAESNLVALVAEAPTPEEAAALANAFGEGVIDRRSGTFHRRIDREIESLQAAAVEDPAQAREINRSIANLRQLRSSPVPDMQFETEAIPPDSPVSPRPALSLAGGMLAGLVVGIGAAFLLQALDPRLRREEQLRARYNLPILARIPREPGGGGEPLTPDKLSPDAIEAYRAVWGMMAASRAGIRGAPVALVTSPSAGEGKTTTSINLAATLAMAGNNVILIEADLRLPDIGRSLDVTTDRGLVSVLIGESSVAEAMAPAPGFGSNLQVLVAEHSGPWLAELFALDAAQGCIDEARGLADFVIIDSPPLTEVVDAMPLARAVDDVVVVARLGSTRLDRMHDLAELLAENRLRPSGFTLVGTAKGPERSYYHDYRKDLQVGSSKTEAAKSA